MALPANLNDANIKPNSAFQNLYQVEAGGGSGLTAGLRKYNLHFMGQYIKLAMLNKKGALTALKIFKFVLDVFVYPVLATVALLGVGINALHVRLNNHSFHRTLKKAIESSTSVTRTAKSLYQEGNLSTQSYNNPFGMGPRIKRSLLDANKAFMAVSRQGLFVAQTKLTVIGGDFFVTIATLNTMNQDAQKKILNVVYSVVKKNPLNALATLNALFST